MIRGTTLVNGFERNCCINDVLYVKDLKCNLFSISRLEKAGFDVMFIQGQVYVRKDDIELIVGKRSGNLYEFEMGILRESLVVDRVVKNLEEDCKMEAATSCEVKNKTSDRALLGGKKKNQASMELWHRRMGHLNSNDVRRLSSMVDGIGLLNNDLRGTCEPCNFGKQTRKPFNNSGGMRSSRVLELIHTDVCGPINPPTWDGNRFIVTFVDDFTHFTMVYLMKKKSEVLENFVAFSKMVSAQFEKKISRLRCDNGGEYKSNEYKLFCKNSGIQIEYTIPYSPELNGVAERMNRTLFEKARSMIAEAQMDKNFWGEAILSATYVTNRSPTRALNVNKTPAEIWFGKTPNLSNVRVFGSTAYAHIPDALRTKLDNKSNLMTMVGYAKNGYRLWDSDVSRIVICRDVKFDECKFKKNSHFIVEVEKCEVQAESMTDVDVEDTSTYKSVSGDDEAEIEDQIVREDVELNQHVASSSRPQRERRPPARYDDYVDGSAIDRFLDEENEEITVFALNAMAYVDDVPQKFSDIEGREDADEWMKAVNTEMNSLMKNRTWSLVEVPPRRSIVSSKWVFTRKRDEFGRPTIYKARLVARGFTQKPGIDFFETYSPVARMVTVRLLLAMAVERDYEMHQMDVCTAFLNGDLHEEIYMKQPEGFIKDGLVCKLNKSLYGLKQASRVWNEKFQKFIISIGFTQSKFDQCLFIRGMGDETVYLLLYVDDLILVGKLLKNIIKIKKAISNEFEMKDVGEVRHFLGITIKRDRANGRLEIDQRVYLEDMLKRFKMENCNGISTPKECNLKLVKVTDESTTLTCQPYRELIGCLMYAATTSRPDLCASVGYFSQFQAGASDEHWAHLKRMLRYVKSTLNLKLTYVKGNNKAVLTGYADSDWGSDIVDRKSVSGYVFMVFGNTISWSTRKQTTVALSSTEAEYVSLSSATCEAIWIRGLLSEMGEDVNKPTTIYEDNQGCIIIASSGKESHKPKHVDIRYHFLRNVIERGDIEVKYIGTKEQLADVMTKALPTATHVELRRKLGLI